MKNTFNGWANIGTYDINTISNLIVTGRLVKEAVADVWLFKYIGDTKRSLNILDFGCGMGRNTFQLGMMNPNWTIVGYDNEAMLEKTNIYHNIHYSNPLPNNVIFSSDWESIKSQKFDCIFCCLVLQHIYENTLKTYIFDFKQMSSKLVVAGRRFNDDVGNRSTWKILEECGLTPFKFLNGDTEIDFISEGPPEDHHLAIYTL